MVELYGYLDMETRDWVDGLFSNIFREMNRPLEREVSVPPFPHLLRDTLTRQGWAGQDRVVRSYVVSPTLW